MKNVPIAIHMVLRCTCLQESMRCGDTESFTKELSSDGGAASDATLQIVHKEGIELGLVKLASAIGVSRGWTSYRALEPHMDRIGSFALLSFESQAALCDDDSSDVLNLALMLSGTCNDESRLEEQKKAFDHVRQRERDESYSGVLRSFLCCANYKILYKAAVEMREEHKKQFGATVYLRELAERSSNTDSPRAETWLSEFEELAKKCYRAISDSGYNRKDINGFKTILMSHGAKIIENLRDMRLFLCDLLDAMREDHDISEAMGKITKVHIESQCAETLCGLKTPEDIKAAIY